METGLCVWFWSYLLRPDVSQSNWPVGAAGRGTDSEGGGRKGGSEGGLSTFSHTGRIPPPPHLLLPLWCHRQSVAAPSWVEGSTTENIWIWNSFEGARYFPGFGIGAVVHWTWRLMPTHLLAAQPISWHHKRTWSGGRRMMNLQGSIFKGPLDFLWEVSVREESSPPCDCVRWANHSSRRQKVAWKTPVQPQQTLRWFDSQVQTWVLGGA